jgi:hypothetical protein
VKSAKASAHRFTASRQQRSQLAAELRDEPLHAKLIGAHIFRWGCVMCGYSWLPVGWPACGVCACAHVCAVLVNGAAHVALRMLRPAALSISRQSRLSLCLARSRPLVVAALTLAPVPSLVACQGVRMWRYRNTAGGEIFFP